MKQKKRLKPTIFLIKNRKDKRGMSTIFSIKNRRGQFYLIAALVIISVIIGYAGISNYLAKKESIKLYDLGEELGIESENVLDFGTYNEFNESEMETLLREFVETYAAYIEEGIEIYFIFGDADEITVVGYKELEEVPFISAEIIEKKVIVTINGIEYEFKLKKGENFYFVISQEIEGEQYVVTG